MIYFRLSSLSTIILNRYMFQESSIRKWHIFVLLLMDTYLIIEGYGLLVVYSLSSTSTILDLCRPRLHRSRIKGAQGFLMKAIQFNSTTSIFLRPKLNSCHRSSINSRWALYSTYFFSLSIVRYSNNLDPDNFIGPITKCWISTVLLSMGNVCLTCKTFSIYIRKQYV